jgi:transcriptional regulator with XRE-family HTH domain
MTEVHRERGPVRLARYLRDLRHGRELTQEKLAERASMLDPEMTVSVDTVRILESVSKARPLPRRRPARGRFALELIAEALGVEMPTILSHCFDDDELVDSCFSWVVELRKKSEKQFRDVVRSNSLADFIASLPDDVDQLLALPGVLQLRNAEAFAYIFALERGLSALEMSILLEPSVMFLDGDEVRKWASGMTLENNDHASFIDQVESYQNYSRNLALRGLKRYKIVLIKQTFQQFLATKDRPVARTIVSDMVYVLESAPKFELAILDLPVHVDELEILSAHPEIPSSLDMTVSIIIRQTSMAARNVEYTLVPMSPTLSGLQRDISRVNQYWSLALDQYRAARQGISLLVNPNRITIELLRNLLADI